MSNSDYYQILGVQRTAYISASDLRQAYKQALLYHHPDKQSTADSRPQGTFPTIDEITNAYKVLVDPALRAEYDRKLNLARSLDDKTRISTRHTGMETVDLEDLEFDEPKSAWTRECRCASSPAFVVTEAELEKNIDHGELITGCKGCSLWLRVLFSVSD